MCVTGTRHVDGCGSDHGNYVLEIRELLPCDLAIPENAVAEGEPPLHDGYVDQYNGGCGSPEYGYPVQGLAADPLGQLLLHGQSGWYDTWTRDQDWFAIAVGSEGVVRILLTPEHRTSLSVYRQWDCGPFAYEVVDTVDRCETAELFIAGDCGSLLWLRVMPRQATYPYDQVGHEYDYLLSLSGLQSSVAVEFETWSAVKTLYRDAGK